jgi:hypothetical protein
MLVRAGQAAQVRAFSAADAGYKKGHTVLRAALLCRAGAQADAHQSERRNYGHSHFTVHTVLTGYWKDTKRDRNTLRHALQTGRGMPRNW